MKKTIFYTILFVLINPVFGQGKSDHNFKINKRQADVFFCDSIDILSTGDSLASFLIRDAINSRREANPLYYFDSSINFWPKFSQFAKHRRVKGFSDLRKGVQTEMKFSKRELKDADHQMEAVRRREWPELFFSNSVRLNEDSLASFRSYMSSPEYRMNGIGKWCYYFSQPVFIRNNSVAIFQLWEMIGHSSGNNLMFVYEKNEQGWARAMSIHAGSW